MHTCTREGSMQRGVGEAVREAGGDNQTDLDQLCDALTVSFASSCWLLCAVGNYGRVILVNSSALLNFIGNLTSASKPNYTNYTNVTNGTLFAEAGAVLSGENSTLEMTVNSSQSESKPTEEDPNTNVLADTEESKFAPQPTNEESLSVVSKSSMVSVSDSGKATDGATQNEKEIPTPDQLASPDGEAVGEAQTEGVSRNDSVANSTLHPCACALVLFYSRYCPFSVELAPLFNALARVYPQLPLLAFDMINDSG